MTGSTQQEDVPRPRSPTPARQPARSRSRRSSCRTSQGALTQLASKRLDGVFSDTSQLAWAAKQQPQAFELLSPQYEKKVGDDIVALGLAKDSPLTAALHAAMQSLMDSPAYQATLDRWGLGAGAIADRRRS